MSNGCSTIITNSDKKHPLLGITSKNATLFHAQNSPGSSRKQWLLNHLHSSGSLVVDDGALKAIMQNKSLLPAGIVDIKGKFNRGDVITILSAHHNKIGIGVSAYDIGDAKKIMGKNSRDISKILGYEGRDEIIHKDDLVKISV
jgi:glutamate 5-kinase